jgi:hypothetical protein
MNIVINAQPSPRILVSEEEHQVVVTRPVERIIELTTPGVQGPAFSGQQYFDLPAIELLSSGDTGVALTWNGSQFEPSTEIGENLTIFGGAF